MSSFNVTEAKKLTKIAKDNGLNPVRRYFIDRIKHAASDGRDHIHLNDSTWILLGDDVEFFRNLGFDVSPTVREQKDGMDYLKYGRISW